MITKGTGIIYTNGPPTHRPKSSDAELAFDTAGEEFYHYSKKKSRWNRLYNLDSLPVYSSRQAALDAGLPLGDYYILDPQPPGGGQGGPFDEIFSGLVKKLI